jgi:hypothetical protein
VNAKPLRFGELIRSLLSGIRGIVTAIQEQEKGIAPETSSTQKTTNKQDSVPPFVRANVHIVESVEVHKKAEETTEERAYQSKTLKVSWLSFCVALATLISLIVYACITHGQLIAIRETNWISRDVAQKQLRAYVGIEPSFLENLAPNSTTTVSFSVTNFGQTPAYNSRIYSDVQILPYPFPESLAFPFAPPLGTKFGSVSAIYPHSPLPAGKKMDRSLTRDEALAVYEGSKSRLYAGGTLFYDDIFNKSHCTRFFASLGGPELVDWAHAVKGGAKPPVPWRISNRYNDDDKCEEITQTLN